MGFWREELQNIHDGKSIDSDFLAALGGVYENSVEALNGLLFFITRSDAGITAPKALVIAGAKDASFDAIGFDGIVEEGDGCRFMVCQLTHGNAIALRKYFPYTAPKCLRDEKITIGLGDRLGLATGAHADLLKSYDVAAVFAQQSIRELNLCGRTYDDVLDDVTYAVFQEGYRQGFGADGDHLKSPDEIKMALDSGYTMITLDCSEHIDNSVSRLSRDALEAQYNALDKARRDAYEEKYLNLHIDIEGFAFDISREIIQKTVLIYGGAIDFAEMIFNDFIKDKPDVVFEISIDETLESTEPVSHFIIASELLSRGVRIDNMAPRFIGEFQKGIDYIGDVETFTKEFEVHCAIAARFGYKISVHSGSDKFRIFRIVGEKAKGRYHLKTSGTNWLEAVRTIAVVNPSLYRRMHRFAEENIEQAKKSYYISAKSENIPDIDLMSDDELPSLLDIPDARQYMHITYGLILNAADRKEFYSEIYDTLAVHEREYLVSLTAHIGRHLCELNAPRRV